MPTNSAFRVATVACLMGATAFAPLTHVDAQVSIKRSPSGFNLFSVQQDVEVGQQSAAEVERQLPILNDTRTTNFLGGIVARLAAQAPGAKYPYSIKAVNATEINAFALPGGPMFVNRGLITTSRNEAELAGVLAHEMSHVILRHGTEQASKAYLGEAGLSILGGLLGKGGTTSQIVNAVGGFGLNAAFLKFSRSDELEADALGAELMAKAGYDPLAMATMFAMLRAEQGRDPSRLERFFSSHPPSAERESRIRSHRRRGDPHGDGHGDGSRTIDSLCALHTCQRVLHDRLSVQLESLPFGHGRFTGARWRRGGTGQRATKPAVRRHCEPLRTVRGRNGSLEPEPAAQLYAIRGSHPAPWLPRGCDR